MEATESQSDEAQNKSQRDSRKLENKNFLQSGRSQFEG